MARARPLSVSSGKITLAPAAAAAATLVSLAGAAPEFTEEASSRGLSHTCISSGGDPLLQDMIAGGVAGDFDRDGDLDLFVTGGNNQADALYLNDGTGQFTDVSAAAGINVVHRGCGAAAGDYDKDGDLDIYVTSIGDATGSVAGTCILYRNNGDGTFTDVAQAAGVNRPNPAQGDSFSASFGDYDLDGDLDLAVAGWFGGNALFRNEGDGTFINATPLLQFTLGRTIRGFAPRFVDMDGDRYPELLWVADFTTSRYLRNNTNGTFTDITEAAGTGIDDSGMGNTFADFDNDGDLDWHVTSRGPSPFFGSGNTLYDQIAPHTYAEISQSAGTNNGWWGWGTDGVDFNHDMHRDIIATNGFTWVDFAEDPTVLYMNNADGTYTDRAVELGINHTGQGRGLLTADFDADGDRDVVILNNGQPLSYYENDTSGEVNESITLKFDTSAIDSLAPDGVGTRVELTAGGITQTHYLDGGTNFLGQSELSVHFGIGTNASADITITYASGAVETLAQVQPGIYTITAKRCAADFQPDGILNFFDLGGFLTAFNAQHPQANLSPDGAFNFFDLGAFLTAFNDGC